MANYPKCDDFVLTVHVQVPTGPNSEIFGQMIRTRQSQFWRLSFCQLQSLPVLRC